jgi:ribosomal protein S27E
MDGPDMYVVPCPKCPTLVTFERTTGALRIACGQCGTTIWSAVPTGGKDNYAPIPTTARKQPRTTATATQTKPAGPPTNDNTIAPAVTLTPDEERRARTLLDW